MDMIKFKWEEIGFIWAFFFFPLKKASLMGSSASLAAQAKSL